MRSVVVGLLFLTGCELVFPLHVAPTDAAKDDAAGGAIAPIQQKTTASGSSLTVSLTLEMTPKAGHVLILVGGSESNPLQTVMGGGVSTWAAASGSFRNQNLEIWYGTAGGSLAPIEITVQGNVAGHIRMLVTEWSQLDASRSLEAATDANGPDGPATAGPIQTVDAPDLLIFGVAGPGNVSVSAMGGDPTASWTLLDPIPTIPQLSQSVWYQVSSATGSQSAQTSVVGDWDSGIAAFRIANSP